MPRFFILILSLSAGALCLLLGFALFFAIPGPSLVYLSILCFLAAVCFFLTALLAALASDSSVRPVSIPHGK